MTSFMLVRHKVRDFSEWKPGYDAHLPKRAEAGLTEKHVLRGANDKHQQATGDFYAGLATRAFSPAKSLISMSRLCTLMSPSS